MLSCHTGSNTYSSAFAYSEGFPLKLPGKFRRASYPIKLSEFPADKIAKPKNSKRPAVANFGKSIERTKRPPDLKTNNTQRCYSFVKLLVREKLSRPPHPLFIQTI